MAEPKSGARLGVEAAKRLAEVAPGVEVAIGAVANRLRVDRCPLDRRASWRSDGAAAAVVKAASASLMARAADLGSAVSGVEAG